MKGTMTLNTSYSLAALLANSSAFPIPKKTTLIATGESPR